MASEPGAWGSPQSAPRIAWQVLPEGEVVFEEVSPATTATVRGVETRVERSGADVSAMARADDPNAGFWRTRQSVRYARGDWDCGLEAQVELTSTPAAFHLKERLIARLRGEVVFDREDTAEIPRDLM